jgi:hypothetical protein
MIAKNEKAASLGQAVKRLLVGAGDIAKDGRRVVTDTYGVYDDTLADAKRLQRVMKRTEGLSPEQLAASKNTLFKGTNATDFDRVQEMQDVLRSTEGPELADRMKQLIGTDFTPQQAEALKKEWGSRQSWGDTLAPLVLGEEPLKVWKERFERGGLVGKGGLLTAELAPSRQVREGLKSTVRNLRAGDNDAALRAARAAALPTALYGGGLAMNYAVPTLMTANDVSNQRANGQSGGRALAGGAISGVANVALNPLGIAPSLVAGSLADAFANKVKGPTGPPVAAAPPPMPAARPPQAQSYGMEPEPMYGSPYGPYDFDDQGPLY